MFCRPPCPFDNRWDLKNARKEEFSYYLIRHESGNLVYPSVNLYDDFIGSCKKFKIVEELGKVNPLIISENLENILKKRGNEPNEDRPDDAFQLGQILFEKENYSEALNYFKRAILGHDDPRAKYQIGVMLFDNLLDSEDVKQYQDPQKAAVYIMKGLLSLDKGIGAPLGNAEIVEAAAYNLFLAYVHGYGVKMSDEKALHYLQIAAENGNTKVSVKAQTAMGLFYSSLDHFDLDIAFYWHTEACQNGSIESQAIIGVMHMFGLGSVSQNWSVALNCLRSASERGSIYATGMLALLYFFRSFYTLASRTAYILVANTELQRRPTTSFPNGKHSNSRISFSGLSDGCYLGERTFMIRAVTVACFIYATCLERGLGVQKDSNAASAMYSKCIQIDPVTTSHLQDMVIRAEL